MNTEKQYICICGKQFKSKKLLTKHQTRCKTFINSRRLPNGMFKCENPDCGKEHDGSYGSGRYCCKKCMNHGAALNASQNAIKNGNKHCPENFKNSKKPHAPYGTWKCVRCNLIFETRAQLFEHNHEVHPVPKGQIWNKGLTKETCLIIANAGLKISNTIKKAVADGRCVGKASTPEKELLRRKRISNSALKRTVPVSTKRTEPYMKKDGTIVNLDSSYERIIAKILDEHNIDWIRPKPLDWYSNDGVKHHYYPDFYLTKYNIYLDPKNDYCFKVQAEKISYVKEHYVNCIFMTKDQLTWEYLEKILERSHNSIGTPC